MGIALSTTLHTSFDDAVERTRRALAEQGFGVPDRDRHEGDAESQSLARTWRTT